MYKKFRAAMKKKFKMNKYNDLLDKAKIMGAQLKKEDNIRKRNAEKKQTKKQEGNFSW